MIMDRIGHWPFEEIVLSTRNACWKTYFIRFRADITTIYLKLEYGSHVVICKIPPKITSKVWRGMAIPTTVHTMVEGGFCPGNWERSWYVLVVSRCWKGFAPCDVFIFSHLLSSCRGMIRKPFETLLAPVLYIHISYTHIHTKVTIGVFNFLIYI